MFVVRTPSSEHVPRECSVQMRRLVSEHRVNDALEMLVPLLGNDDRVEWWHHELLGNIRPTHKVTRDEVPFRVRRTAPRRLDNADSTEYGCQPRDPRTCGRAAPALEELGDVCATGTEAVDCQSRLCDEQVCVLLFERFVLAGGAVGRHQTCGGSRHVRRALVVRPDVTRDKVATVRREEGVVKGREAACRRQCDPRPIWRTKLGGRNDKCAWCFTQVDRHGRWIECAAQSDLTHLVVRTSVRCLRPLEVELPVPCGVTDALLRFRNTCLELIECVRTLRGRLCHVS